MVFGNKSRPYFFIVWYPNLFLVPSDVVLQLAKPERYSFHFFFSFVQIPFDILDFVVDLAGSLYSSFVFVLKLDCFQHIEHHFFGVFHDPVFSFWL